MSGKFYAVKEGRAPGIYTNHQDALKQTVGFSGCQMKKFKTEYQARAYLQKEKEKEEISEVEVLEPVEKDVQDIKTSDGEDVLASPTGQEDDASADREAHTKENDVCEEPPAEEELEEDDCQQEENLNNVPDAVVLKPEVKEKAQKASQQKEEFSSDNKVAVAYSDGSWRNGVCGWGVVFSFNGEKEELAGAFVEPKDKNLCSMAGELRAAKEAIRLAVRKKAKTLHLYYDFTGVERYAFCDKNGLHDMPLEYRGFYECASETVEIIFHKVKSHSGNEGNNRADKLAKRGLNL